MDKLCNLKENGVRIHVTPNCNYRCYFCHNEGQSGDVKVSDHNGVISLDIIKEFIDSGVYNYTFTGGEPLLYGKSIIKFFSDLLCSYDSSVLNKLDFTIVTNGALLNDEYLDFFSSVKEKTGDFKFNISLHTVDEDLYNQATGTKNKFYTVTENIIKAVNRNIKVKLNYVLLKNKNSREDYIERIIDFSISLGVKHIKIIEMLITELNRDFFYEFHEIQPLIYNLKYRAKKIISDRRKTTYYLKDKHIAIDFIRCTCAVGCKFCLENREIEISGNSIKPCFMKNDILLSPEDIKNDLLYLKVIEEIEDMILKYEDSSPSLIYKPKYISYRLIFRLQLDEERFNSLVKKYARTCEEYKIRNYSHPMEKIINNPFEFYLYIPSQSPETSRIVASKKENIELNGVSVLKETFIDKIYDFARSRLNVCENKLAAMAYVPGKEEFYKEDILQLKDYENKDDFVLLKKVVTSTGKEDYFLQISSNEDEKLLNNIITDLNFKLVDY